ncbi:MAG: glycosyltransferase, partial [Terracoccus sp.]
MTLLVISPDYASHLYPLATLATAWRDAGERVVVATGPATDAIVRGFEFERVGLQLGRGSNPGVIRAEAQPQGEDDALRGFFAATRRGAVATLEFQARARGADLLWNPVGVARAVHDVLEQVRPDEVIVDHLAFGARLALTATGTRHADVVLGHPSALTVGDEVYGYPPAFPRAIRPDAASLAS